MFLWSLATIISFLPSASSIYIHLDLFLLTRDSANSQSKMTNLSLQAEVLQPIKETYLSRTYKTQKTKTLEKLCRSTVILAIKEVYILSKTPAKLNYSALVTILREKS